MHLVTFLYQCELWTACRDYSRIADENKNERFIKRSTVAPVDLLYDNNFLKFNTPQHCT